MRQLTHRAGLMSALLATATGLTGCSNFRDLFSAHADVAAEAGGMELSSDRLAQILAGAGGRQKITREAAEFVAGTWVEYALFAQAVAKNQLPTDSADVAEALWPEISELKGTHYHDTLMASRTALSDSAADSLYRVPDVRVLQHILFGVRPNSPAEARGATRKKAEGTLTRLKGGASFDALADSRFIDSTAPAISSCATAPAFSAVVSTPVPSALVRIRTSPGRAPALVSRRSGCPVPVTARPYLSSSS